MNEIEKRPQAATQAEFRPVFTWRHYLFGNNLIAGCFQLLAGAVTVAIIAAVGLALLQ